MIIVDSSAWIDHLRYGNKIVEDLLYKELACTTGIIKLEIIPFLKKQHNSASAINFLQKISCVDIAFQPQDWNHLISYQDKLINNGLNGLGIPDLLIIHISKITHTPIYSLDKHIQKASEILNFKIYHTNSQ